MRKSRKPTTVPCRVCGKLISKATLRVANGMCGACGKMATFPDWEERAARIQAASVFSKSPTVIAIDPDDYHARHVGHALDGRQFFLTTPNELKAMFVALYTFDAKGSLLEAAIDAWSPDSVENRNAVSARCAARLEEIGPVQARRIVVAPFAVERFGIKFGLVPKPPESAEDTWWVEAQPGSYMAFHAPWDSGVYDT
jgi:hypothetical protein